MPDIWGENAPVVSGNQGGREVGAGARATQLGATAPVVPAAPTTGPLEATGGREDISFSADFASTSVELAALLPLQLQPEEVLGYKAAPGDPVTGVVTVPVPAEGWAHKGYWRIKYQDYFGLSGRMSRTIISSAEITPRVRPVQSGQAALEDVSRWTGLSHEALGASLGASRRSVYNWLRGRAMSAQFEGRVLRLRAALRPLAERRAPGEIVQWLAAGAVAPAELLRDQRWEEFEARVREEVVPRVAEPMPPEPAVGDPETYSAEARQAVLTALRTPPPVERPRRPDWRPREVTGATPIDDEVE